MTFDRILRDELSELAELRREVSDLKSTVLSRISGLDLQWKSFTPTLTASVTNPTLGTGGSTLGRYVKHGRLIIYRFFIQFGSGSNGGNGEYRLSTPVDISATSPGSDLFAMGDAVLFDWSVAGHKELAVVARRSNNQIKFYVKDATVFHNNPFVWTDDDRFGGTAIYEST